MSSGECRSCGEYDSYGNLDGGVCPTCIRITKLETYRLVAEKQIALFEEKLLERAIVALKQKLLLDEMESELRRRRAKC